MSVFSRIDDKFVPLYRVLWVAAAPHFCGEEDCQQEGQYEVRLEGGDDLWATDQERDDLIQAIEHWHSEPGQSGEDFT